MEYLKLKARLIFLSLARMPFHFGGGGVVNRWPIFFFFTDRTFSMFSICYAVSCSSICHSKINSPVVISEWSAQMIH